MNPNEAESEKIMVAVRVRKLLPRELRPDESGKSALHWEWKGNSIWPKGQPKDELSKSLTYDRVFPPSADNEDVHTQLVQNVIGSVLGGFNATIFAYGQTASGKTHTMLGTETDPGIILRSIDQIFEHIERSNCNEKQFLLRMSYIEIYKENLSDLLVEQSERKKLWPREDGEGVVVIENLEEVPVQSKDDIFALLNFGENNRHYGETNMNERSSRSHTIFRLLLESSANEMLDDDDESSEDVGNAVTVSQLNLVDLAGSERAAQTGAVGERLKEGGNINKSLMMLSQVIGKLSEGSKEHIPFRNSKLTHILKNSLGGNARTAMICTVTPAELAQTKSTLEFASRVKKIVQHAKKNEILNDKAHLTRLQKQIAELQQALIEKEQNKQHKDQALMEEDQNKQIAELQQALLHKDGKLKDIMAQIIFSGSSNATKESQSIKKIPTGMRRMSWHPSAIGKRMSFMGGPPPSLKLAPIELDYDEFQKKLIACDLDKSGDSQEAFSITKPNRFQSNIISSRLASSPMMKGLDLAGSEETDMQETPPKRTSLVTSRKRRTVKFCDDPSFDLPPTEKVTTRRGSNFSYNFSPVEEEESVFFSGVETPREVLKKRLVEKERVIDRLSTEYQELQEFTRMENQVEESEKRLSESSNSNRIAQLEEQMEEYLAQIDMLENENATLKKQPPNSEIVTIQNKEEIELLQELHEAFENDVPYLKDRLDAQIEHASRLERMLLNQNNIGRDFEAEKMEMKEQIKKLQEAKSVLEGANLRLSEEVQFKSSAGEEREHSLATELARILNENEVLRSQASESEKIRHEKQETHSSSHHVEEVKLKCTILEEEMEEMKRRHSEVLKKDRQDYERIINELQEKIRISEKSRDDELNFREDLQQAMAEKSELEDELKSAETKLFQVSKEIECLTLNVSKMEKELQSSNVKSSQLEEKCESNAKEIASLETTKLEQSERIRGLEEEGKRDQSQKSNEMRELIESLTKEKEIMLAENGTQLEMIKDLEERIRTIHAEQSSKSIELSQTIDILSKEKESVSNENETLKESLKILEETKITLEENLSQVSLKNQSLLEALSELQINLENSEEELSCVTKQVRNNESKEEELRELLQSTREQNKEFQEQIETLTNQMNSTASEENRQMLVKIEELNSSLESVLAQLNETKLEKDELTKSVSKLETRVAELANTNNALLAATDDLESRLEKVDEERSIALKQLSNAEGGKDEINIKLRELESENEKLQKLNSTLESKQSNYTNLIEQLQSQCKDLESNLAEKIVKCDEHELCKDQIMELNKELDDCTEVFKDYQDQIKNLYLSNGKLEEDVAGNEENLKKQATLIQDLKQELKHSDECKSSLQSKLDEFKICEQKLQAEIANLKESEIELKKNHSKGERALMELEYEKQHSKSLKEKLRRLQADKMESTVYLNSKSSPQLDSSPAAVQTTTNSKKMIDKEVMTDQSAGAAGSRRKNCICNSEQEDFAKLVAEFEKGSWSSGSGVYKEYALETVKQRNKQLVEKNEYLQKESEFYHDKAQKWKNEALKLQRNVEKEKLKSTQAEQAKVKSFNQLVRDLPKPVFKDEENRDPGNVLRDKRLNTNQSNVGQASPPITDFTLDVKPLDMDQFKPPHLRGPKSPSKKKKSESPDMRENCKQQ